MNTTETQTPSYYQISTRASLRYRNTLEEAMACAQEMVCVSYPVAAIVHPDGVITGVRVSYTHVAPMNVASFGLPFTKPFAVVSRSGCLMTEHDTEAEALVEAQTRCSASDTRTAVFAAGNSNKVRHFDWDGCSHQPREVSLDELARQEREAG